jgi:hypothetical protein
MPWQCQRPFHWSKRLLWRTVSRFLSARLNPAKRSVCTVCMLLCYAVTVLRNDNLSNRNADLSPVTARDLVTWMRVPIPSTISANTRPCNLYPPTKAFDKIVHFYYAHKKWNKKCNICYDCKVHTVSSALTLKIHSRLSASVRGWHCINLMLHFFF